MEEEMLKQASPDWDPIWELAQFVDAILLYVDIPEERALVHPDFLRLALEERMALPRLF